VARSEAYLHAKEGHQPAKNGGDGGGGYWLIRTDGVAPSQMVGVSASVNLPLLIFICTIKSRSSLLAPAHSGSPVKRAVKRLWCGGYKEHKTVIPGFFWINQPKLSDSENSGDINGILLVVSINTRHGMYGK